MKEGMQAKLRPLKFVNIYFRPTVKHSQYEIHISDDCLLFYTSLYLLFYRKKVIAQFKTRKKNDR